MIRFGLIPFWWDLHSWHGLTLWWSDGRYRYTTWGPFKWRLNDR